MTTLLKSVIDRLARFPKREQDFYARQLAKELDADAHWDELFTLTTDAQWSTMVEEAKRDAAENGTLFWIGTHGDYDTLLRRLG